MDYAIVCAVQLVLICITLFFLYKEKYTSGMFQNRVNISTQNIFKFGTFMDIFAQHRKRANSMSSSSSTTTGQMIPPPLLRRLSEISTDSGQSFDSTRKQEEYIIDFLDLLQSQTGQVLSVDRKLAIKMVEIALNSETESRMIETKTTVSEKLDEILDSLSDINQRLTCLEAKFQILDRNNNQIIEND